MSKLIPWSLVDLRCPCHGSTSCPKAESMSEERERIMAAQEWLCGLTPAPVSVGVLGAISGAHVPRLR